MGLESLPPVAGATACSSASVTPTVAATATSKAGTTTTAASVPARSGESATTTSGPDVPTTTVASSTTPSTTTGRPSTESSSVLDRNVNQPGRNLLVGLLQEVDEVTSDVAVAPIEEGGRGTGVSGTSGTTDSVGVFGDVVGQVVQDDVHNVGDIETTSGDGGGNKDGSSTRLEHGQGVFTFTLSPVSVNRGSGEPLVAQEVAEHVGHTLGLDKDQDETSGGLGVEDVEQQGSLILVVDVLDVLLDVLRGRTDSSDREEDVLLQERLGEDLNLPGEGGREHQSLPVVNTGHIALLNDGPDLGLETHVQHSVGLVEDEVLDVGQRDLASVHQVDETTGSGGKQVTTTLDLTKLVADLGTTVNNGGTNPRSVSEPSRLLVDLGDELSGRGEDQGGGVLLSSTRVGRERVAVVLDRLGSGSVGEHLRQDGEEETTGLSRTGLSTGHQVSHVGNDGDRVLLNRGRGGVSSRLDVLEQDGVERRVGKLGNGVGNTLTGGFDGDVGVSVKVETGRLRAQSVMVVSPPQQSDFEATRHLDSPDEHHHPPLRTTPSPS
jgi:hypothetical protein